MEAINGCDQWTQTMDAIMHPCGFLRQPSISLLSLSISLTLLVIIMAIVRKSRVLVVQFIRLVAALLLALAITQGLKALISRDRPFDVYPYIEKLSSGGDSSFPSGHTLEAFAVAAALSLLFSRKWVIIPVYAWAVLVAYSRMALGVHYPTDVLAGIMIGSFIGWVVTRLPISLSRF